MVFLRVDYAMMDAAQLLKMPMHGKATWSKAVPCMLPEGDDCLA